MVVAVVVVHYWAGVAADRAGEVSPGAGGVHREFRRGVPGRASSQPVAVVEDACRHPLATLLADVRRTLPRRRLHRNGFVINTAAMTGNGFYRAMLCIRGWRRGVVVSTSGPVSTLMGDRLRAGIPSRYVTSQLSQLSLASLRYNTI